MRAIFACDLDGGIGKDGRLPWPKVSGDLARFKRLTLNSAVIMGRGTYESKDMPVPLPNRMNIVVSSTLPQVKPGIALVRSPEDAIASFPDAWVIGGSGIISAMWDAIDEIHLTLILNKFSCDRVIPLDKVHQEFELIHEDACSSHAFQTWTRK